MAKKEAMKLIQFQKAFQMEEACHRHLVKMKWPDGFRCPKCKHDNAYEITTRKLPLYECVNCRHQTTVIAGTIFGKTRTDLVKWFWAKVRKAMGERDSTYTLAGIVELDDTFFGAPTEGGKRGRGTE